MMRNSFLLEVTATYRKEAEVYTTLENTTRRILLWTYPLRGNSMNQKRFLILSISLIAFAVLIAGGLFYWYEYRPNMIREKYSKFAEGNRKGLVYV